MNKHKNLIFNILFVFSIVTLIYTLGFFTNFTSLLGIEDKYYNYAQQVNGIIFNYAALGVIAGSIIKVSNMMKHKDFVLYNYVLLGGFTFFHIMSAVTYLQQLPVLRNAYRKLDFETVMRIDKKYVISEQIFNIGTVVMIMHILVIAVCVAILAVNLRRFLKERGVKNGK